MCPMNSLKKLTCLGSSGPYSSCGILKESITISWQELSALVYGHRAWHGASCEEEKKRRICSCCVTCRKKLFMILYVHCTKEKENISYIVQASSMLQGFPCPGTTEPIHSSSQGNQNGDRKPKQNALSGTTAKL